MTYLRTEVSTIGGLRWHLRPGTTDWNTVNACAIGAEDEYRLAGEDLLYAKVFDIGAHIGGLAVSAAERGALVVAVEPVPENAHLIRENLRLNGFTECEVVEAAVGADTVRYDFEGDEFERHHAFIGNSYRGDIPPSERTCVELAVKEATLSGLAGEYGRPDIIKIDCEGGEWEALADPVARETRLIVGEWHPTPDYQTGEVRGFHDLVDLLGLTHKIDIFGPLAGPAGFRAELL